MNQHSEQAPHEPVDSDDLDLESDDQAAEPVVRQDDGLEAVETPIASELEDMEHIRIDIRRALPDRRLDKYLSGRMGKEVSRTAIQRFIKEGVVTVNQKVVKPSYVIRSGDSIDLMLRASKPKEILPEPIPLDVIYEDDDVMGINKQANLIVHPARGNWSGTLVNALAYYFQQNWRDIKELPTSGEVYRPGIVHRLDRDTTGIMLVAKSELALWRLGRQFEMRRIHKTYSAIVHGLVAADEDTIDAPLGKHPKMREKYAVQRTTGDPFPGATKEAVTKYRVLARLENVGNSSMSFSLVELYPQTGRTHQLRVHMSYIGHPMIGDKMYGGGPLYRSQLMGIADRAEGPLITRQALHAHIIEFQHPRTLKMMTLEAPWPKDFTDTLAELKSLSK